MAQPKFTAINDLINVWDVYQIFMYSRGRLLQSNQSQKKTNIFICLFKLLKYHSLSLKYKKATFTLKITTAF